MDYIGWTIGIVGVVLALLAFKQPSLTLILRNKGNLLHEFSSKINGLKVSYQEDDVVGGIYFYNGWIANNSLKDISGSSSGYVSFVVPSNFDVIDCTALTNSKEINQSVDIKSNQEIRVHFDLMKRGEGFYFAMIAKNNYSSEDQEFSVELNNRINGVSKIKESGYKPPIPVRTLIIDYVVALIGVVALTLVVIIPPLYVYDIYDVVYEHNTEFGKFIRPAAVGENSIELRPYNVKRSNYGDFVPEEVTLEKASEIKLFEKASIQKRTVHNSEISILMLTVVAFMLGFPAIVGIFTWISNTRKKRIIESIYVLENEAQSA